jgi:multisubunit Na+/H+ antiporter MnhB subunit
VEHPLRYIIPPLIVLIAIAAVYIPMHRHKEAVRKDPHHHIHKPVSHITAAGVVAVGLIVAFIAAFILP